MSVPGRFLVRRALVVVALGCAGPPGARGQSPTRAATAPPAEVLARSLALEAQGDVVRARQVVVDAFGPAPTLYEPCVRLAALSFQLHRSGEAVQLYRLARELPNSQPEATLGLGLALTMHGYDQIARGALGGARSDLLEALIIDDSNLEARKGLAQLGGPRGSSVDAVASSLSISANQKRFQLYSVLVPVRMDEKLALRFSAQQLNGPDFVLGGAGITATTQFYAGLARDVGISTLEGLAVLSTAAGSTTLGVSTSARVGGLYGIMASAAAIGLRSGTSVQVAPVVFARPRSGVLLSAGTRVTHDPQGTLVSPLASIGLRGEAASLDLRAHFGKERAAFLQAQPMLQPYLGTSRSGVAGALSVRVATRAFLLAEAQVEQSDVLGSFRSVGIGVRIVPH